MCMCGGGVLSRRVTWWARILEKLMMVGVLGRQNGLEWGELADGRTVKILGIM